MEHRIAIPYAGSAFRREASSRWPAFHRGEAAHLLDGKAVINEDNKMDVVKFTLDRRPERTITVEDDCGISKAKNEWQHAANDPAHQRGTGDSGGSWAAPMRISWEALQSDGPTIISSRRVNYV
jgi:hypothetical protein